MNYSKRIFDILLCILACFLLIGPVLAVAITVRLTSASQGLVIFWSNRVGRDNKIFLMAKFRTMHFDTPNVATNGNPPKSCNSMALDLQ